MTEATKRHLDALQILADSLRETAVELRAGKINMHHAANRITKIANQLASAKKAGA